MMHALPPHLLLLLFVAGSIAAEAASIWLLRRQARFVRRHRNDVPAAFRATVTAAEHRRAADYTGARAGVSIVSGLLGLLVTLFWVCGGLDLAAGAIDRAVAPSAARDVLLVGAVAALSALAGLPLAAWRTLVVEGRFGFNRSTPALWALDRLKGAGLAAAIGAPLLWALFVVMRHATGLWWLWAWMGLSVLSLLAPALYVRLIAPLFNRFEPLADTALAARIEALLERCGFHASGLYTMDASRRSSHGNAFFIGWGRSKRIVLFDTLLASQTPDEIEAVVAHELGHFKHRHVVWGTLRGIATSFVLLALVGWLCRQPFLTAQFGFAHRDEATALLAANFLLSLGGPLLSLPGHWLSRRHEFQADDYARRQVGAAPLASALTRLTRDNASTLTPDPLFALVHYSHPPVSERLAHLQAAEAA